MKILCNFCPTSRSSPAKTTAVGKSRPTSSAWEGPVKVKTRFECVSSFMTSDMVFNEFFSSPLARFTKAIGSIVLLTSSKKRLTISRTAKLGTATITKGLGTERSEKQVKILTFLGRKTPGRYSTFSLVFWSFSASSFRLTQSHISKPFCAKRRVRAVPQLPAPNTTIGPIKHTTPGSTESQRLIHSNTASFSM